MKTLTRNQAVEFIKSLHDKIFGVVFTKKDGSTRTMSARINVGKHANGGELPYDPEDYDLIPVFDCNKEDYRMIPVDRLHEIRVDGKVLEVKDG